MADYLFKINQWFKYVLPPRLREKNEYYSTFEGHLQLWLPLPFIPPQGTILAGIWSLGEEPPVVPGVIFHVRSREYSIEFPRIVIDGEGWDFTKSTLQSHRDVFEKIVVDSWEVADVIDLGFHDHFPDKIFRKPSKSEQIVAPASQPEK